MGKADRLRRSTVKHHLVRPGGDERSRIAISLGKVTVHMQYAGREPAAGIGIAAIPECRVAPHRHGICGIHHLQTAPTIRTP